MSQTIVPISKVHADENQPRKFFDEQKLASLTKSIKMHGILNPLSVEKHGDGYLLVDGERRFRAAQNAGIKEVPINVLPTKDKNERAVEQFHLQEMHEGWTAAEKAEVIAELCKETGKTFTEVCNMLNIKPDNARKLWAISKLSEKALFAEKQISAEYAEPLTYLTKFVKNLKESSDQPFTLSDKKKLERSVIKNISNGTFNSTRDITRLKDTFKSNPDFIEKFVGGADAGELFVESKARAAYHLRNATSSANYAHTHINSFLRDPRIKLDDRNIVAFRGALKAIKELLAVAGVDEES